MSADEISAAGSRAAVIYVHLRFQSIVCMAMVCMNGRCVKLDSGAERNFEYFGAELAHFVAEDGKRRHLSQRRRIDVQCDQVLVGCLEIRNLMRLVILRGGCLTNGKVGRARWLELTARRSFERGLRGDPPQNA